MYTLLEKLQSLLKDSKYFKEIPELFVEAIYGVSLLVPSTNPGKLCASSKIMIEPSVTKFNDSLLFSVALDNYMVRVLTRRKCQLHVRRALSTRDRDAK